MVFVPDNPAEPAAELADTLTKYITFIVLNIPHKHPQPSLTCHIVFLSGLTLGRTWEKQLKET